MNEPQLSPHDRVCLSPGVAALACAAGLVRSAEFAAAVRDLAESPRRPVTLLAASRVPGEVFTEIHIGVGEREDGEPAAVAKLAEEPSGDYRCLVVGRVSDFLEPRPAPPAVGFSPQARSALRPRAR